jgi:hypothetical protein
MPVADTDSGQSATEDFGIQHFYYLLIEELYQRTSLLQAQARHATLVASFLAQERLAGAGSSIAAIAHAASVVEDRLTEIAAALLLELADLSQPRQPPPFPTILAHRVELLAELTSTLGYQRTLQRALAAELDSLPPDYARPAAIHGLEQFEILTATNDVATRYGKLLLDVARQTVLNNSNVQFERDNIILAFEPLPFPRQRDYVPVPPESPDSICVFARLPVWYCYMPRYHPNIAHELAHAVMHRCLTAQNSHAHKHRRLMVKYSAAVDEAVRLTATPDVTQVFANIGASMLLEFAADLLALRVAGPAYILSLAVAILGAKPLSTDQHLSTPMRVRLRLLLEGHETFAAGGESSTWDRILAVIRQDIDAYDELAAQEGHHGKLRYQRVIHDISRAFLDEMHDLWRLGVYSRDADCGAETDTPARAFRSFLRSLPKLPQYSDLAIPLDAPEMVDYLKRPRLEHGPGIAWLLYFANVTRARQGPLKPFVPEGRIFHEWHRCTASGSPAGRSDRQQPSPASTLRCAAEPELGQYYELLFHQVLWSSRREGATEPYPFKRMRTALQSELDAVVGRDKAAGSLFSVFGLYDFLTVRQRFEAKRFVDWPPGPRLPFPCYPHRHIAQEIIAHTLPNGRRFTSALGQALQPGQALAVSLIKFENGVGRLEMLSRVLDSASVECTALLLSLGWEDLVAIWSLRDLADVAALHKLFARQAGEGGLERTLTQILVVPATQSLAREVVKHENRASDSAAVVRFQIHVRAARGRKLCAVEEAICTRTCFHIEAYSSGRFDLLCSLDAADCGDLTLALDDLEMLTGEGLVAESETTCHIGRGRGDS